MRKLPAGSRTRTLVLNPYGRPGEYSGPSIFLDRLFGALARHGAEVIVVSGGLNYAWAKRTRIVTLRQPMGAMSQLRWAVRAAIQVWRERKHVDLVHVHGCYLFGLLPALAALGLKLDYTLLPLLEGGDLAGRSTRHLPGVAIVRRFIVRRARVGFALSEGIAGELRSNGLDENCIARLPNIVDVERYAPVKRNSRHAEPVVGLVGKLGERKGVLDLLRSLHVLRASRSLPVRGLFVGPFESVSFQEQFWSEVDSLGLNGVVSVTGFVTDVRPFLGQMSVFALPSWAEGMPGALCEAMASGLPVVVSTAGSMQEVVRRSGAGSAVVPGDVAGLAQTLERLLIDEDAWREASERSRAFACREFDANAAAGLYLFALGKRR